MSSPVYNSITNCFKIVGILVLLGTLDECQNTKREGAPEESKYIQRLI